MDLTFAVSQTFDYEDGLALCEHLGLDKETILQRIRAHAEPHTTEERHRKRDLAPKSPSHISSGINTNEENDLTTEIMDKF